MDERDVKKLASNIYRLADLLQESKDKDFKKKFPELFKSIGNIFENECKRLEEWIKEVKE